MYGEFSLDDLLHDNVPCVPNKMAKVTHCISSGLLKAGFCERVLMGVSGSKNRRTGGVLMWKSYSGEWRLPFAHAKSSWA